MTMKIRNITYTVIAITCVWLSTGCSFDENPYDQIPEEEAYTNTWDLYQNAVASLYNHIGSSNDGESLQGTSLCVYDLQTFGSDEAVLPTRGTDWYDGGIWQDLYRHSWKPGLNILNNSWTYLYKVIALCNRSLENIDSHRNLFTDEEYTYFNSEVRALRAIYYWYLIDLFGRVPLFTATNASMNEVQQSERSEVFRFAVSELQYCCDHLLNERSTSSQGDFYGRVTRPVACFALAKLLLNAEVYTDDNWTDGIRPDGSKMEFVVNGQKMNAWKATEHYCNLIESIGYSLAPSFKSNFDVDNDNSPENIWIIPMDPILYNNYNKNICRSIHYRHAADYGQKGKNGSCATKRVLEIFHFEQPDQDTRFDMSYWSGIVTAEQGKVLTDRSGSPLVYYPWQVELDLSGGKFVETAGARMKKYAIDKNALKDGVLVNNDIVLFRFADVLLMRAEARLRNGEDGQADFDLVRKRVGMPSCPLTLESLSDERLKELCWEGWRRQDLVRFNQYKSLYDGEDKVDESDGHTTVFPIPSFALALNHNLKQNFGYQ